MEKSEKRIKSIILLLILVLNFVSIFAMDVAASGTVNKRFDFGSGWTAQLHNPNSGKNYYHVHFYYKNAEKYCLRLDTLQPCDGFKKNPVPKWVMKKAESKLEDKWGYNISRSTISWGKTLAIFGCALLIVVLTICPFDGPAGDATAWGLLLGVV